ncbi:MAG: hypothetical protein ACE5JP_12895 [Candidatus Bipolaricaulia bacterium]
MIYMPHGALEGLLRRKNAEVAIGFNTASPRQVDAILNLFNRTFRTAHLVLEGIDREGVWMAITFADDKAIGKFLDRSLDELAEVMAEHLFALGQTGKVDLKWLDAFIVTDFPLRGRRDLTDGLRAELVAYLEARSASAVYKQK